VYILGEMIMRVLVTGANGQLGHDVVQCLEALGLDNKGISRKDFDLSNTELTESFILEYKPDVIIHCAAYTNVDQAEVEQDICRTINVNVTAVLAGLCKKIEAKLVYISTDYVFEGIASTPYEVFSPTNPLSVYGSTKLEGERLVRESLERHFIIRTSWAFGLNGINFVKTMLKLGENKEVINVVSDQFGSPTYTKDLAELITTMIQTEKYGTYHVTNEGYCSWAEFAADIFSKAGFSTKVSPISSEEYISSVKRPKNSRLSKSSLDIAGFRRLPPWTDALTRFLNELL
jgi:dTDP-4-dehydrorhamnose reductase